MTHHQSAPPLAGLKVLDLSRILAGPATTQLLGDLGADIVKVEQKNKGDDTRTFGPPFLKNKDGNDTTESPFYLSANRNKRSIGLDFTDPTDLETVKKMAQKADILIENFKTGHLTKFGLDYASLQVLNPSLIYCSITGFGQTGPYASYPGYDFLIQARGGIMGVTGEPNGEPQKVAVGIADLMAGMYASTAILAALHERQTSHKGQYIDISLLDCQIAWLSYVGQYYLTSGKNPPRLGNAHASIVPYQAIEAKDHWIALGVGNDSQFQKFCACLKRDDLAEDPRFTTNQNRVQNREALIDILRPLMRAETGAYWIQLLNKAGIPCSPINTVPEAFADPQVQARGMKIQMHHKGAGDNIDLIGNPIKFSRTKVEYKYAPPQLNEHEPEILKDWLGE
jgi:crotonobetainyl-CoA:carnitine CoA-transferase CaiB-like acyl-CoA transferase